MPERSLLSIVARTAYWLGWHHHFGPASGSDPKIADPLGRYCMAVFTGGVNIGPYEAARHIAGVSARELSMVRNRHIDLKKLNSAIATVVNAFAELDVVKAWGDGTAVAADGTQVETYIDNLPADLDQVQGSGESRTTCDNVCASQLHPRRRVGGGHLIEGLRNKRPTQPSTVHADTQGQSAPVFALATLFGFDLMPHPAGDEPGEQRHVGVRDVVVRDAAHASVPDRCLGQEVVDIGAGGRRGSAIARRCGRCGRPRGTPCRCGSCGSWTVAAASAWRS